MDIRDIALKNEEKAIFALRELYGQYGYTQYKMSKFEEYDLYVRNKDFLISDSIITFTDTDGKLLALKPDVTLSIIKNSKNAENQVQKVFYNENVYRVTKGAHAFREIMQVGLECIGAVDLYHLYEVLMLAAQSLRTVSADCVLDLSHLGIVSDLLDGLELSRQTRAAVLKCIGEKSVHEIRSLCQKEGADGEKTALLCRLVSHSGSAAWALEELEKNKEHFSRQYLEELSKLCRMLESAGFADMIHVDFSVINDMNYYNGIVFKGFVNSIPTGILSGGQYDKLMEKMKKPSRAIGFAVYLDLLNQLEDAQKQADVDTLLLYDEGLDPEKVNACVNSLRAQGKSVMAQMSIPEKISYRHLMKLDAKGAKLVETDA